MGSIGQYQGEKSFIQDVVIENVWMLNGQVNPRPLLRLSRESPADIQRSTAPASSRGPVKRPATASSTT